VVNVKALIQALPEYSSKLGLLSAHITISEQIKNTSEQRQLMEVGLLEQDIVYGEKSSQELIKYLAGTCLGETPAAMTARRWAGMFLQIREKTMAAFCYACHIKQHDLTCHISKGCVHCSQTILMTAAV
jgi:hypothetical protein